jgi:peptidoglycan/xylan/chitin deacetylase (PgdA/CDA1 family)
MQNQSKWPEIFEYTIIKLSDVLRIPDITIAIRKRDYILMYHSVDGTNPEYRYEVTIENFVKHLAYLRKKFKIVPLDQFYNDPSCRNNLVALTFDDAYEDFYRNVYPLLIQFNIPATLFVPTEFIDSELNENCSPLLYHKKQVNWDQLREMHASGLVEIGSHTHSHRDMKHDLERFEDDVRLSMQLIEEHIGHSPKLFAYPYGSRTPEMDQIIRMLGFKLAVMSQSQERRGQFLEGRLDIYRRNQSLPYFKHTMAGYITTNAKEIYRKIRRSDLIKNKAALQ